MKKKMTTTITLMYVHYTIPYKSAMVRRNIQHFSDGMQDISCTAPVMSLSSAKKQ